MSAGTAVRPATPVALITYKEIEKRIRGYDRPSIEARWEFGRLLAEERGEAKQLPRGRRDEIAKATGVSLSELGQRFAFTVAYPTREKLDIAISSFPSWSAWTMRRTKKDAGPPPKPPSPLAVALQVVREIPLLLPVVEKALKAGKFGPEHARFAARDIRTGCARWLKLADELDMKGTET